MSKKNAPRINMPSEQGTPQLDVISAACDPSHIVAIVFSQSTSVSYPLAVQYASGATKYGVSTIGKKALHFAAFGRSKEQAARAVALLKLIGGWRSTQIFTSTGVAASNFDVTGVLECYIKSTSNKDRRAHCHWVREDNDTDTIQLIPCRYLYGWIGSNYAGLNESEKPYHSTTMRDRVLAVAVNKGCSWCPNFNADEFKEFHPKSTKRRQAQRQLPSKR